MAVLKDKVYVQGSSEPVKLSKNLKTEKVNNGMGAQTSEIIDIVDYNDDISTQALLEVVSDLVDNDRAINDEKNAINELFGEGVIHKIVDNFEYSLVSSATTYAIKVANGKYNTRYTNSAGEIVSRLVELDAIEANRTFVIPALSISDYFRNDTVALVVTINEDVTVTIALEFIKGDIESSAQQPLANGRSYVKDNKTYYPLYAIQSQLKNSITTNIYIEQLFSFSGLQSVVKLDRAIPHKISDALNSTKTYFQLYKSIKKPLCFATGVPLTPDYGQATEDTTLGGSGLSPLIVSHAIPDTAGAYQPLKDNIDAINANSRFVFPFKVENNDNPYLTNNDQITVKKISCKYRYTDVSGDDDEREGIEAHVYKAKHYRDAVTKQKVLSVQACANEMSGTNNNVVKRTIVTVGGLVTHFTESAYKDEYATVHQPQVGDVILVVSGVGLYQVAYIESIIANISSNTTTIGVSPLSIQLVAGQSKIMLFQTDSECLAGSDYSLTDAKYTTKYWYDVDNQTAARNTAINKMPYDGKTKSGVKQVTVGNNVEIPFELDVYFDTWYFIKYCTLRKNQVGATYNNVINVYVTLPDTTESTFSGDFSVRYCTHFGSYILENDSTLFSIYDKFGGLFTENASRLGAGKPSKYVPYAYNFISDKIVDEIIVPSGFVYVDVLTGRFKFANGEAPENTDEDKLYIDGYINNIIYGEMYSEQVMHYDGEGVQPLANMIDSLIEDISILKDGVDQDTLKLRLSGVIKTGQQFDLFTETIDSNIYLVLKNGKALLNGNIISIALNDSRRFKLSAMEMWSGTQEFTMGDAAETVFDISKKTEGYILQPSECIAGDTCYRYPLDKSPNFHVYASGDREIPVYDGANKEYYRYDASTGKLTVYASASTIATDKKITIAFNYSCSRYDSIEVNADGTFSVKKGVAGLNPSPVVLTSTSIRLYNIKRVPFSVNTIHSIVDCRTYLDDLRQCQVIDSTSTSSMENTINHMIYHKTESVISVASTTLTDTTFVDDYNLSASNGDLIVAIVKGTSNAAYSVNGGLAWSKVSLPLTAKGIIFDKVKNAFLIIGGASAIGGSIIQSADGSTWTPISGSDLSISGWNAIATSNNGMYVACTDDVPGLGGLGAYHNFLYGASKYTAPNTDVKCAYSTDLKTWTEFKLPSSYAITCITYGDGVFAMLTAGNYLLHSTDGIMWSGTTICNSNWSKIIYADGYFIATRSIASGTIGISYNGHNWFNIPIPVPCLVTDITYQNGKVVLLGHIYSEQTVSASYLIYIDSISGIDTITANTLSKQLTTDKYYLVAKTANGFMSFTSTNHAAITFTENASIDEGSAQWKQIGTNSLARYTSSKYDSFVVSHFNCNTEDELWMRCDFTADKEVWITAEYNSVADSEILDKKILINTTKGVVAQNNNLIFIADKLEKGNHTVKITIKAYHSFAMYALIVGRLDMYHTKDTMYLADSLMVGGSLVAKEIAVTSKALAKNLNAEMVGGASKSTDSTFAQVSDDYIPTEKATAEFMSNGWIPCNDVFEALSTRGSNDALYQYFTIDGDKTAKYQKGTKLTWQKSITLASYYTFDNITDSKVYDTMSPTKSGTVTGGAAVTTGKFGNALPFNGTSQYIQYSYDAFSAFSNNVFTVGMWFNSTTSGVQQTLIDALDYTSSVYNGAILYIGTDDRLYFGTAKGHSATSELVTPFKVVNDGWHQVIVTFKIHNNDVGMGQMYVDGNLVADGFLNQPLVLTSKQARVGNNSSDANYFKGLIDEFFITTAILPESYINQKYQSNTAQGIASIMFTQQAVVTHIDKPVLTNANFRSYYTFAANGNDGLSNINFTASDAAKALFKQNDSGFKFNTGLQFINTDKPSKGWLTSGTLSDLTTFNLNKDFTISMWIKSDGANGSGLKQYVLDCDVAGISSIDGYSITLEVADGSGTISRTLKFVSHAAMTATPPITIGTIKDSDWHLITITCQNKIVRTFVDGVLSGSGCLEKPLTFTSGMQVVIGASNKHVGNPSDTVTYDHGFHGCISDFYIINGYAQTIADADARMRSGSAIGMTALNYLTLAKPENYTAIGVIFSNDTYNDYTSIADASYNNVARSPFGFDINKIKWQVISGSNIIPEIPNPAIANTRYAIMNADLIIPEGLWNVEYDFTARTVLSTVDVCEIYAIPIFRGIELTDKVNVAQGYKVFMSRFNGSLNVETPCIRGFSVKVFTTIASQQIVIYTSRPITYKATLAYI